MKIGKRFNQLTLEEYFYFIDNYKKYTDFNTLGLYRSIIENERLSTADKVTVREYANKLFQKYYAFLQLKDPLVYFELSTIELDLTSGDKDKIWNDIRNNQQKILTDKRIKHRNFGDYSKHNCGIESCVYNGMMVKQNSVLSEGNMHFKGDKNKYQKQLKSVKIKSQRKEQKQIVTRELDIE